MHIGWPQVTLIALYALSLGINAARHGEMPKNPTNFWHAVISAGITMTILWWGGFFG